MKNARYYNQVNQGQHDEPPGPTYEPKKKSHLTYFASILWYFSVHCALTYSTTFFIYETMFLCDTNIFFLTEHVWCHWCVLWEKLQPNECADALNKGWHGEVKFIIWRRRPTVVSGMSSYVKLIALSIKTFPELCLFSFSRYWPFTEGCNI